MKPSSTWFALILIASVLLLSGASCSKRPSPVPNPRHIEKQNEPASFGQQPGQPDPTPFNRTNSPVPNLGNETSKDQTDGDSMSSGLMIAATIVMALATGAIAWFNFQLVGVTNQMRKATAEAAKFTKLAYIASRPYLIPDNFVMLNFTTQIRRTDQRGLIFMTVEFVLKNVGKGPAIVEKAGAKLKILPDDPTNHRGWYPNPSDDWGISAIALRSHSILRWSPQMAPPRLKFSPASRRKTTTWRSKWHSPNTSSSMDR
jgi:hypothetical protein